MADDLQQKIHDFIFGKMPFKEAIEFFQTKVPLTREQFDGIEKEAKVRAFTVSGIASLDILQQIHNEIEKALKDGTTLQDFKKNTNTFLESKGYEGFTAYQADNIFRTNIQTAYQVGKYKQLTDPDILKARPYWEYDAEKDSRTRAVHKALDGKVYPANHPFWDTWYPPNGYRCRCTVKSRSKRDIERLGKTIQEEIPDRVETPEGNVINIVPEQGFDRNPGKDAWQPDLEKYSPALKAAYLARKGGDNLQK